MKFKTLNKLFLPFNFHQKTPVNKFPEEVCVTWRSEVLIKAQLLKIRNLMSVEERLLAHGCVEPKQYSWETHIVPAYKWRPSHIWCVLGPVWIMIFVLWLLSIVLWCVFCSLYGVLVWEFGVLFQEYNLKAYLILNIMSFNLILFQFIIGTAESVTDNLSIQVENHALSLHEQVVLLLSSNNQPWGILWDGKAMKRVQVIGPCLTIGMIYFEICRILLRILLMLPGPNLRFLQVLMIRYIYVLTSYNSWNISHLWSY